MPMLNEKQNKNISAMKNLNIVYKLNYNIMKENNIYFSFNRFVLIL